MWRALRRFALWSNSERPLVAAWCVSAVVQRFNRQSGNGKSGRDILDVIALMLTRHPKCEPCRDANDHGAHTYASRAERRQNLVPYVLIDDRAEVQCPVCGTSVYGRSWP
jgi:hypothetical protein